MLNTACWRRAGPCKVRTLATHASIDSAATVCCSFCARKLACVAEGLQTTSMCVCVLMGPVRVHRGGTWMFKAPEQMTGPPGIALGGQERSEHPHVELSTDVWALGAMICTLCNNGVLPSRSGLPLSVPSDKVRTWLRLHTHTHSTSYAQLFHGHASYNLRQAGHASYSGCSCVCVCVCSCSSSVTGHTTAPLSRCTCCGRTSCQRCPVYWALRVRTRACARRQPAPCSCSARTSSRCSAGSRLAACSCSPISG